MSDLLKCDRCGAHYEQFEAKHSLVVVDKRHAWTGLLSLNSLDLCKDCHNQLEAWFSHPNNEKTEEVAGKKRRKR